MITVRDLLANKRVEGVWSVTPETTVYQALELMAEKNVGALLVMTDNRLIGVFSERDYARKCVLKGRNSRDTRVADLMSSPVIYVHAEQSAEQCLAIMTQRQIRHLPVMAGDEVIGVVSIGDVGKAIISHQQEALKDLETYITGVPR
ncbi:MAG: CBS domain-containing protein [Chloroflexi bacterium]|nr:CBS domain-containing protein [Chloroflexota bacterium]